MREAYREWAAQDLRNFRWAMEMLRKHGDQSDLFYSRYAYKNLTRYCKYKRLAEEAS